MLQRIDHLVYAAPDLDAACAEIERRLGVAPSPGGQHIGRGTRNALVAIGPKSYLEIIAPDPDQPNPNRPRWFKIDSIETPRLVAWAASATNLPQLVADAARRGVHLGSVTSGSRERADGVALDVGSHGSNRPCSPTASFPSSSTGRRVLTPRRRRMSAQRSSSCAAGIRIRSACARCSRPLASSFRSNAAIAPSSLPPFAPAARHPFS